MSDRRVGKKISIFLSQEPALNPKKPEKIPENDFEGILKEAGFIIGKKNDSNELNVDQAIFLKDLNKKLSSKNSSELKDLITGFETHLEDEIRLKWSLMPTVTSASCETARSMSQDSLIHLLLNIEAIQEKVTEIMLSKLIEFSYCENNALYDRSENRTVACLIISQFRWLSRLVNSEAFADKLLELIEATPIDVQRDILRLLPDVINEFDHPKVAKSLGEILLSNQDLKVIILDILTNLNVQPELLADIREKVIKTITTAEIEDLPVIVKFVLQDLSATEAPHIIQELRETLDFNSTFRPMVCSTPLVSKKKDMTKSVESCVLSIMKHAMEFQKCLTDAWIKQLEVLTGPQNHKSIDIFVILILLSLQNYEKKVESIVKNKIRAGDLNEDLLQSTFRCHHGVLQEYASIFLRVADSLLRASEPIISGFAKSIYIKCFVSFDAFNKQEVIGSLIIHVGSRSETEINAALDTLLLLVRNHTSKIVSYALFIKNLLDHLNELTLNQIRKVHEMLSILGYQGGREGSMLLDDMMIVIRKQLTNKNLKYRKMGVIGALMAAKVAAEKDAETSMDVSLSSESLDVDECYQHSIKLLELVADSTLESCEAYSLFCDELSHILLQKKLGQPILDWVGDKVLVDFEETYIIDIKPEDYAGKSFSPKYGLDEVNEPVAIDLYTIVKNDFSNLPQRILKPIHNEPSAKAKGKSCLNKSKVLEMLLKASNNQDSAGSSTIIPKSPSPLKLAPMFRLLRVFRQVQDDNLDSIDALLGCAIVLPELRHPKFGVLSTNEKHMILNVLFYCINWVRESINAFATANDRDIRCNVLSRLQLLVEMEGLVCKYLIETNGYTPPMANFDCDEKTLCALKLPTKKSVKRTVKSKKGSKKKSKKASSSEQTEETSLESSRKSKSSGSEAEEFEAKQSTDVKLFKNLQPFFRELDMSVFTLLQCEITFQKRSDILENEKVTSLQMHPTELKFLLEDLSAKLNLCLSSTPAFWKGASQKHMGFSNLESYPTLKIVTYSVQLISPLCNVVLEFAKFFRNLVTSADGVEDSLILFADETQYNIVCFNLVLKVLKQIMSWKNFNLNENSSLLKKALTAFVLGEEVSENTPLKDLVKHCVKHLIKFANAVPSLSCASNLMELLVCISNYSEEHDSKAKISSLALAFLKKKWFDLDSKFAKTVEVNIHIRILLEAYLKTSASVLKALDFLSAEAIPQLMDQENEVVFHSLNKTSFGAYYKIMMSSLASYVKVYFATKHSDQEQMFEWSVAFKVFQVFTNLLKTFGSRSNIAACLKSSREFLHTFLKFGMPLMDKLFVENKEDVICLMKILQASTRYLQHVCCHSKVLKDVSLIQHVPFLKKSLEVFLFRVKMMLAVNKCEDAFWLGNLKNRDLKGEEILSQSLNDDNSEAEEREEEEENKSEVELSDAESEV